MTLASILLIAGILIPLKILCLSRARKKESQRRSNIQKYVVENTARLQVVELSDSLATQIFRRPNGSFGYYYLARVESYDGTKHWRQPPNMGEGSVYDTAAKAEAYARLNAAIEAQPGIPADASGASEF
ncbi:MAG: hypothetical protein V4857_26445 [Pseudomonadota bacterium]